MARTPANEFQRSRRGQERQQGSTYSGITQTIRVSMQDRDASESNIGRPTDYTLELGAAICGRLSCGESLRSVCRDPDMPARSSVYLWLIKYPEFSDLYAKAKDDGSDAIFDEIIDIADDGSNDWMERHGQDGQSSGWALNGEHVQRSKLRIDARKFYLSKIKPKKYGDRPQESDPSDVMSNLLSELIKKLPS